MRSIRDALLMHSIWGKTVVSIQKHIWTRRMGWIATNKLEVPYARLRPIPEVMIDDIREWLGYEKETPIIETLDVEWNDEGTWLCDVVRVYPETRRVTRVLR